MFLSVRYSDKQDSSPATWSWSARLTRFSATLDEKGTLGKLPFMPEMREFCGRQFRVSRRAFKTCVDDTEMRQLDDTVFLEDVRCDGEAHGGCDKACLIFWKEAWLRPVGARRSPASRPSESKINELDLFEFATARRSVLLPIE